MFTGIIESLGKVESLQKVVMCAYGFKPIWICPMCIWGFDCHQWDLSNCDRVG
jgi:hypothetical protein